MAYDDHWPFKYDAENYTTAKPSIEYRVTFIRAHLSACRSGLTEVVHCHMCLQVQCPVNIVCNPEKIQGFPYDLAVKNPPTMRKMWVWFLGQEDPLEEEIATQSTPVFLPGRFHGQRSLVGYSPWGHKRVGHNLGTEHNNNNIIGTTVSFSYTSPSPCGSLHARTHHSIYLNDLIFTSSLWLA